MEKMWLYILVIGMFPTILWVLFWLREDDDDLPEPRSLVWKTFLAGGLAAILALIIQSVIIKYQIYKYGESSGIIAFAVIEEILKFLIIYFVALRTKYNNERMDPVLYMIIGAIGFSSVENMFFLVDYLNNLEYIKSMIDSSYRFVGSTLVHTISSAFIGLGCAIFFFKRIIYRFFTTLIGLSIAIIMHSLFNFLVTSGNEFYKDIAFYGSWFMVIIFLVIFEFLRRETRVRPKTSIRHIFYKRTDRKIRFIRKDTN